MKKKSPLYLALRHIFAVIAPWRTRAYLGVFLFLGASLITSVIPYIYGNVTDFVLKGKDFSLVVLLLGLWLGMSLIRTFLLHWGGRVSNELSINVSNEFLTGLFSHVITLPMSFHKERRVGSIARRITNGADRGVYDFIERILFSFLPDIVVFAAAVAILTSVEWRLSLILIFTAVLYSFLTLQATKRISGRQRKVQRRWEKTYGFFFEALSSIRDVKISGNENYEKKRTKRFFDHAGRLEKIWLILWNRLNSWQSVIMDLGFVAVFTAGSLFLAGGKLTAGQLIMFVGYTSLLMKPLSQLGSQYRLMRRISEHVNRAASLFNISPEQEERGRELEIKGNVEFRNVSFSYGKNQKLVLEDITLEARAGEAVALVGRSGVGKTTLVDLLGKYYFPRSGTVKIDGIDLKKINLKSLRSQMAIVPQDVSLFSDTVFNNIRYARPRAKEAEVFAAAEIANAHEFISEFPKKYRQKVGERGVKLSAGQKQRIAIARAVLRNPKILILDEATSALDSASEKMVQEALSRLIRNRTTFIIAHRLSTIRSADKIIVLEKGRIAEMGTHEELMKNESGIYRNFWELQTAREAV